MNQLSRRIRRMKSCDYWMIAYRKIKNNETLLEKNGKGEVAGFHLLPQEKFITQADPFLFTYEGESWLFYEKQDLTDMKGTLWCVNLDVPGSKPVCILEEDFHLSYPQVFRYGKGIYMLPETRGAGDIRLYRCLEFPGKWEFAGKLFDLEAVDTTVLFGRDGRADDRKMCYGGKSDDFEKGHGRCHVFTYTRKHLEIYDCQLEQDTFQIRNKEKIYTAPISATDRPGGSIVCMVEQDGRQRMLRPAQNCTDYYGQELLINEIDSLHRQSFQEHVYCRLTPEQIKLPGINPVGIHTYNRNERYEVIDILHREISVGTIWKKIKWKLRGSGK